MTNPSDSELPPGSQPVNIARRLRDSAADVPSQAAVVFPQGRDKSGRFSYTHLTFEQLDRESDLIAEGLRQMGVKPGTRLVLMVPPSLEFIVCTFALFKVGAVAVLIDPGMGRSNIFKCLEHVRPDGFVGIPVVHAIRIAMRRRFPQAKLNVTVGRKFGWGGKTYAELIAAGSRTLSPSDDPRDHSPFEIAPTVGTDLAAIIFTSGSTGPPKGVCYEHGMFDAQVELLRRFYDIQPGEVDLPGFPLFALFNSAMRVTTVIPDMNPTRPADVEPENILQPIRDWGVTQAFGSPALWNRVSRYCVEKNVKIPSVKRVLSAGAPVPVPVLERMTEVLAEPDARMHTPYGATECLPIASNSNRVILTETAELTNRGAGVCVGKIFPGMEVKIVQIRFGTIPTIEDATELEWGNIGEIIVRGPVATREYDGLPEATENAKIIDGFDFWHRMGDVGCFDKLGRLWFCGRKAHIVDTMQGRLFTIPCEAIFNNHPRVYRTALVGLGDEPIREPVIIVEPEPGEFPQTREDRESLIHELLALGAKHDHTRKIRHFLFHESLPVDIRHNVKINRELLSRWATKRRELLHRDAAKLEAVASTDGETVSEQTAEPVA